MSSPTAPSTAERYLGFSAKLLVGTVWLSATIFGLYILTFYFLALFDGNTEQWNKVLPGLFDQNTRAATVGIGVHFAAGGIILILGCIQLLEGVRKKYPGLHRWLGRLYVLSSIAAALGGLFFIFNKGTVGGWVMDVGFTGYGLLTFGAAIATIHFARAGSYDHHRAWAIRLFALAIGSWLYRMDYGFWFLFTDGLWHTKDFRGGFDYFMAFWFYLPNLFVAEIFIGRSRIFRTATMRWIAGSGLLAATLFLLLATYFFTRELWGPAIMGALAG